MGWSSSPWPCAVGGPAQNPAQDEGLCPARAFPGRVWAGACAARRRSRGVGVMSRAVGTAGNHHPGSALLRASTVPICRR